MRNEDSVEFLQLAAEKSITPQSSTIGLFRHQNKRGEEIKKTVYAEIALFIIHAINVSPGGAIALNDLIELAQQKFGQGFNGSVYWYLLKVKEDLESRGIIQRLLNRKKLTQNIKLKKKHHQCVVMIASLAKL